MSDTYAVVFKGEVLDGADEAAVKQKVGAMFKANEAKLAALFSGKPVAIKKGIDEATANKFVQAFAKAGAKAYAKDLAAPTAPAPAEPAQEEVITAAPPPPAEPESTTSSSSDDEVNINPASAAAIREAPQTTVNIQPQGSLDDLSMGEQSGFLVEPSATDPTPAPEAIEADLAAEGTTIPAPPQDTTPAPEAGDWDLDDGPASSGGKASFSLDP